MHSRDVTKHLQYGKVSINLVSGSNNLKSNVTRIELQWSWYTSFDLLRQLGIVPAATPVSFPNKKVLVGLPY